MAARPSSYSVSPRRSDYASSRAALGRTPSRSCAGPGRRAGARRGRDGSRPVTYIVHYAGGTWSRRLAPTESGYTNQVGNLALIPGTTSVWGAGSLTATSTGATAADIIKHGP
jgi:hypothetical protein